MRRLQAEARRADMARDDAVERAEALEREMDAAHDAGYQSAVEALQIQHQQAEVEIESLTNDFDFIMQQIGTSERFWYEEDAD